MDSVNNSAKYVDNRVWNVNKQPQNVNNSVDNYVNNFFLRC